ncbi:pentatricopeptide repeat-containing protein At5g66520-like [Malania oleifera]|uniref:pentatricopeptide repeat-containing protein At5g66520-like n=1 Tax=Malania oleifera TaxID=397392 RepID=UPI0025AECA53|nr:pentatricopeptide repeat-containing protein At5g66520-like [Malania oleifera]
MRFPTKSANPKLIVSLLQEATHLHDLLQIHALLVKTSLDCNNFVLASLFRRIFFFSVSPAHLCYARSIFDFIPFPDAFLWNTMIGAYSSSQYPEESLALFLKMQVQSGAFADSFSFSPVLRACGRLRDARNGETVHAQVVKFGFCCDVFVQTALVEMYAKLGNVDISRKVFDEMTERDLVLYNVLLAEYIRVGEMELARDLFDRMPERDLVSWNTMIHGCASLGDRTSKRGIDSWAVECVKNGRSVETLRLFHEMQLANVAPDKVTMVSILSTCGDVGALGMGRVVYEYVERNKIEIDLKLGTSLVDMYAKCGDIDSSLRVFNQMKKRDVFAWSALIIGLANHGFGEVALDYFSSMVSEEIKPNGVTFIGVLTACSHIGLVDKGWTYFMSMSDVFGVTPAIEHYGCMVDILGRAGQLQEAKELIKSMPFPPDAIVWRALLGACRIYKNVEIAEVAIVNLLELEPHVDGNYVLLSNVYSQDKQWDNVTNVRRMMKTINIQKVPGCSSIEIDNAVHEFIAGDKSHEQSVKIYQMLAEMTNRLKISGYKPLIDSVLQDFDYQEKENVLAHHSEKLAIAFGLLSTAQGSPIRIFKNLRVCDDCHLAIKFISKIYDRKIIVRDRNRFHHFVGGSCSCKDYW